MTLTFRVEFGRRSSMIEWLKTDDILSCLHDFFDINRMKGFKNSAPHCLGWVCCILFTFSLGTLCIVIAINMMLSRELSEGVCSPSDTNCGYECLSSRSKGAEHMLELDNAVFTAADGDKHQCSLFRVALLHDESSC